MFRQVDDIWIVRCSKDDKLACKENGDLITFDNEDDARLFISRMALNSYWEAVFKDSGIRIDDLDVCRIEWYSYGQ